MQFIPFTEISAYLPLPSYYIPDERLLKLHSSIQYIVCDGRFLCDKKIKGGNR